MSIPYWGPKVSLNGYPSCLLSPSHPQMERALDMIKDAKRPVVYAGGGCLDAAPELKEFIESTGIPITNTLMGLGCYPASDELCLDMLGMHEPCTPTTPSTRPTCCSLRALRRSRHREARGVAARASIVHIDIDPAEIGKNKEVHCPVFSNIKPAFRTLNSIIRADKPELDFSEWRADIASRGPSSRSRTRDGRLHRPAARRELLCEMTRAAVVSTGVGQHQMWAAQHYKLTSRGTAHVGRLGLHGLRPPAAIGAAAARPDAVVVDIAHGPFVMNIQSRHAPRGEPAGEDVRPEQPAPRIWCSE